MYIKRHAEKTVDQLSKMFGAVLVAGPRQVGKTTMLDQLTGEMNKQVPKKKAVHFSRTIHLRFL